MFAVWDLFDAALTRVCAGQALHDTVFFCTASHDGKYYV